MKIEQLIREKVSFLSAGQKKSPNIYYNTLIHSVIPPLAKLSKENFRKRNHYHTPRLFSGI